MNFTDKTIFITGGTGSWGNEVVEQIITRYPAYNKIIIFSRGEHKQFEMRNKFNLDRKIEFIVGDIRDKSALNKATRNTDVIIHLAALKHVPICENNPWETILTNVYGTQNVVDAALLNRVQYVVDVSTDKAVDPLNIYGMSKACGEKLVINANLANQSHESAHTKFICVRGGNVLGTNGSVFPLFKKQIQESNKITLTNPQMTRYLMSKREAVGLLFNALDIADGGELFVMKMPAASVQTMADAAVKIWGNHKTKKIIIGQRPGEKIHEVLISVNEASRTKVIDEMIYCILPEIVSINERYAKYNKFDMIYFDSNNAVQLNVDAVVELLRKHVSEVQ